RALLRGVIPNPPSAYSAGIIYGVSYGPGGRNGGPIGRLYYDGGGPFVTGSAAAHGVPPAARLPLRDRRRPPRRLGARQGPPSRPRSRGFGLRHHGRRRGPADRRLRSRGAA